jgi:hypothetical protein
MCVTSNVWVCNAAWKYIKGIYHEWQSTRPVATETIVVQTKAMKSIFSKTMYNSHLKWLIKHVKKFAISM